MDDKKKKAIELLVDSSIENFVTGLTSRYEKEVDSDLGVVNMKKNNCFIAELGEEFMFYSAFVRSFDSSFGNVLETLGNNIAKLSYDVRGNINSFMLPDQTQRIASILDSYGKHTSTPAISHYENFDVIYPKNTVSFQTTHVTDNYFYNPDTNEHYLIMLKSLDNCNTQQVYHDKEELLTQFFLLKNSLSNENEIKILLFYCLPFETELNNSNNFILNIFEPNEFLLGKQYWNFVCNDNNGYSIVSNQVKKSIEKHSLKVGLYD